MSTNQIIELIARAFEEGDFSIPYDEYGELNEEELCNAIAYRIRSLSNFLDHMKE